MAVGRRVLCIQRPGACKAPPQRGIMAYNSLQSGEHTELPKCHEVCTMCLAAGVGGVSTPASRGGSELQDPHAIGAWLSLVERCVRDAEVAGSNPVAPT